MTDFEGHIVVYVLTAWGHNKPMCALLGKLVRISQIKITYFTGLSLYDRVLRELEKQFLPEREHHLRSRIRVAALPNAVSSIDHSITRAAFLDAYRALCSGQAIPVMPENIHVHEALAPPQLVVLDFFLYEVMKPIRSITGPNVPIYAWQSASTSACLCLFGPEYLGGHGDLAKKLEAITGTEEKTRYDEAQKLYHRMDGNILRIPGLPPMYDHEFSPQAFPVPIDLARHTKYAYRMFSESDGSIHASNAIYEGPGLEAWAKWLPNGPVIPVGPLLTPVELAIMHERRSPSRIELEVEKFLDNALENYGENSLFYMSFGTAFWSAEPDKIWVVLDVLIELHIPFLFSHASRFAVVPDEVKDKVAKSGLGYISEWLPQQAILRHKACGWFISHGGQSSTMESLAAGVPIIFWPYAGDQPMNAANVTINHNAAFELFEVRTGEALTRPIYCLGGRVAEGTHDAVHTEAIDVFTKARGEHGRIIRENARRLGVQLVKHWAPGGDGWKELQKIVAVLQ